MIAAIYRRNRNGEYGKQPPPRHRARPRSTTRPISVKREMTIARVNLSLREPGPRSQGACSFVMPALSAQVASSRGLPGPS